MLNVVLMVTVAAVRLGRSGLPDLAALYRRLIDDRLLALLLTLRDPDRPTTMTTPVGTAWMNYQGFAELVAIDALVGADLAVQYALGG